MQMTQLYMTMDHSNNNWRDGLARIQLCVSEIRDCKNLAYRVHSVIGKKLAHVYVEEGVILEKVGKHRPTRSIIIR